MLCVIFIRPVVSRNIFPEYRHLFKRVKREKDLTYPPSITQQHLIIVIMIMGRRALLFYLVWGVCVCPCECVCVCAEIYLSVLPQCSYTEVEEHWGHWRNLHFPFLSCSFFLPVCLCHSSCLQAEFIFYSRYFKMAQKVITSVTQREELRRWTEQKHLPVRSAIFFSSFFFFFFFFTKYYEQSDHDI